ncbi:sequence-specific DNA binding transcription factors [Striga asiatica]|uniref:Sequence-specific DNA binding transcription factors n=1 Tax=Striga asiatica TaxID=4170 RepID=A0A5A7R956_STRAF|nr:sequence-specific DNA binding transcription factors [Striga asiatica]
MGRPPSNGAPSFRFNPVEFAEMEAILQRHNCSVPGREIIESLAQKFSATAERAGKVEVSSKQVMRHFNCVLMVLNWFQNRRYALRTKAAKAVAPNEAKMSHLPTVLYLPQATQPQHALSTLTAAKNGVQVHHPVPAISAMNASGGCQMEFEAKSARDGAWYDVTYFLSSRSSETGDPEVLVRFAGFGPEEDEWINIRKHVRQRSLPCESSECVAVLPGDLALCFQEGKEQALYFDAHILNTERRRHDEVVPLRKICRRPETNYRLRQLHATSENVNSQKMSETTQKQPLKPE